MFDTTHQLTSAMAAGDARAVECFYRRYIDWLYAQARSATHRDEAFCMDVVQDSMLRIIRTIQAVHVEGQLRAFLQVVVRTTALDRLKAERRRQMHEAQPREPSHAGVENDQIEWLHCQIAKLDPELSRLVEMRYQHGFTLAHIASLVGLPMGTIDGRLRRLIKTLRVRALNEDQ